MGWHKKVWRCRKKESLLIVFVHGTKQKRRREIQTEEGPNITYGDILKRRFLPAAPFVSCCTPYFRKISKLSLNIFFNFKNMNSEFF